MPFLFIFQWLEDANSNEMLLNRGKEYENEKGLHTE
jgi:hypothetical protein